MYDSILIFITAFSISYLTIPILIAFANKYRIFDLPNQRKAHSMPVPPLGGIAIFIAIIASLTIWASFEYFSRLQYLFAGLLILFLIGVYDDIEPIKPQYKFIAQITAAIIFVVFAQIRLTSLDGIFGIERLPYVWSVVLTVFTIIVVINAFNLIDGINGLSASLVIMVSLTLGIWFYLSDRMAYALVAFALSSPLHIKAAPAVAVGMMILPLFDTLRVFVLRLLKRKNPFHPDRLHIHHILIDVGFSHTQATAILTAINLLFIYIALKFRGIGNINLLIVVFGFASLFTFTNNGENPFKIASTCRCMKWLLMFIGGGLGSMVRYQIGQWLSAFRLWGIPWGTLGANFTASFLLGLWLYPALHGQLHSRYWYAFAIVGFCGGFSTFSTFAFENYTLVHQNLWDKALQYITLSLISCLIGVWLGLKIGSMSLKWYE